MNGTQKKHLYEIATESWAMAPLAYLATTHYAIVSRFEGSFRYVSLRQENAETFSYEFASILRDACSAFGSFSDAVVRSSAPTKNWKKPPNIKDFFDFYASYEPALEKVSIVVHGIAGPAQLQPFRAWTRPKAPAWWEAHNDVKHSEYKNAVKGNLQNATNAVAAVETVLRCATSHQQGTTLFRPWGGHWEPEDQDPSHAELLFCP